MAVRKPWSRAELLVAASLYCRIPFGRFHSRNPELIHVAERIGRTSSALAMKLSNLASVDPTFRETGRRGLASASSADRAIWDEMNADWPRFAVAAQRALDEFGLYDAPAIEDSVVAPETEVPDYAGRMRVANRRERVGQDLFRDAVLSAYEHRCCITGLAVPALLNASHIVPWREDPENRLNPANGLCLSALHDRAFDKGFISLRDDLTIMVSRHGRGEAGAFYEEAIEAYADREIFRPEKFEPHRAFLDRHRTEIFLG